MWHAKINEDFRPACLKGNPWNRNQWKSFFCPDHRWTGPPKLHNGLSVQTRSVKQTRENKWVHPQEPMPPRNTLASMVSCWGYTLLTISTAMKVEWNYSSLKPPRGATTVPLQCSALKMKITKIYLAILRQHHRNLHLQIPASCCSWSKILVSIRKEFNGDFFSLRRN